MPEEIVEELVKQNLFKDVPIRHLKRIARLVDVRDVQEGEELLREGTHGTELFLVFSGSAEATARGRRRATWGPGEFFGELALLLHGESATVTAQTPMRLGAIGAREFKELIESEPSIAFHMLEALILRLEDMMVRPAGELH